MDVPRTGCLDILKEKMGYEQNSEFTVRKLLVAFSIQLNVFVIGKIHFSCIFILVNLQPFKQSIFVRNITKRNKSF